MTMSIKRQRRYDRHVTTKGERNGRCIRQHHYLAGIDNFGRPMYRVAYLHVTKGWRDRRA